ncbi:basic proline-rich protein-like [Choloepus didactylus]|uniref:basic proline-rich protein-like n=1 Tax=Choloepus didactylus TaxID=27675 RepID=UPI00189E09CF|nr:basic proline-rich protein-like [Choloepus didactylus]
MAGRPRHPHPGVHPARQGLPAHSGPGPPPAPQTEEPRGGETGPAHPARGRPGSPGRVRIRVRPSSARDPRPPPGRLLLARPPTPRGDPHALAPGAPAGAEAGTAAQAPWSAAREVGGRSHSADQSDAASGNRRPPRPIGRSAWGPLQLLVAQLAAAASARPCAGAFRGSRFPLRLLGLSSAPPSVPPQLCRWWNFGTCKCQLRGHSSRSSPWPPAALMTTTPSTCHPVTPPPIPPQGNEPQKQRVLLASVPAEGSAEEGGPGQLGVGQAPAWGWSLDPPSRVTVSPEQLPAWPSSRTCFASRPRDHHRLGASGPQRKLMSELEKDRE